MKLTTAVLAGLGLVTSVLGAPASLGSSSSKAGPTYWENTRTQEHRCEGKDLIRCETTADGVCLTVDFCEIYCFDCDKGAACVDMSASITNSHDIDTFVADSKASFPEAVAKVTAGSASPQEDKHYACSKDRTGVLICRYDFCSTDHYCKSSEECKDDSMSCETKSLSAQGVKSEVRTVSPHFEAAALSSSPGTVVQKMKQVTSVPRTAPAYSNASLASAPPTIIVQKAILAPTILLVAGRHKALETEVASQLKTSKDAAG